MSTHTYQIEEARRLIADQGLIAKVSAEGSTLVVYDGDEDRPGTWMEVDRLRIVDGSIKSTALQSVIGH